MLMLYLFSMLPGLLFHHHHHNTISFTESDSCQKAVYYGIQDKHKEHLSKVQDQCQFCDHHTQNPQLIFNSHFELHTTEIQTEYFSHYNSFHSIDLLGSANKDPPLV